MKQSGGRKRRGGKKERGHRKTRHSGARTWRYIVAIAAAASVVALLIVLGALGRGGDGDGGGGPVALPSPRSTDVVQDGHVLGSADAPVTVIEYADFQ